MTVLLQFGADRPAEMGSFIIKRRNHEVEQELLKQREVGFGEN